MPFSALNNIFAEAGERIAQDLERANFIMEKIYPKSRDPRLFLVALGHLKSVICWALQESGAREDGASLNLSSHLNYIEDIFRKHQLSSTEIKVHDKYIIFNNNFKEQTTISRDQIEWLIREVRAELGLSVAVGRHGDRC